MYIRGEQNVSADLLSRTAPVTTEWCLTTKTFLDLQSWRGQHLEVDLFASPENAQLPLFVCPYEHPRAHARDALTHDWNQWGQIYLFPPPKLLNTVVQKLSSYTGHGLLIAPYLPHAPWFSSVAIRSTQLRTITTGLVQTVQCVVRKDFPPSYAHLTAFNF